MLCIIIYLYRTDVMQYILYFISNPENNKWAENLAHLIPYTNARTAVILNSFLGVLI